VKLEYDKCTTLDLDWKRKQWCYEYKTGIPVIDISIIQDLSKQEQVQCQCGGIPSRMVEEIGLVTNIKETEVAIDVGKLRMPRVSQKTTLPVLWNTTDINRGKKFVINDVKVDESSHQKKPELLSQERLWWRNGDTEIGNLERAAEAGSLEGTPGAAVSRGPIHGDTGGIQVAATGDRG
jgi:hypothetical protein